MRTVHTIIEMHDLAKSRMGKCLSKEYMGLQKPLEWKCHLGHTWFARPGNIINGSWCPECAISNRNEKKRKFFIEDARSLAVKKGGLFLSDNFENVKKKYSWECANGHVFTSSYFSIYYQNTWCSKCSKKIKLTIEEMQEIAVSRGGKCLSKTYFNLDTPLEWECADGHIFNATPDNIKHRKSWCPYCKTFSTEQKCRYLLYTLLKVSFLKTKKPLEGKYELDGYNSDLKLAFEYRGKQHYEYVDFYYKSEEEFKKRLEMDAEKIKMCNDKGIRLLIIPYWESKSDVMLFDYILCELNKFNFQLDINFNDIDISNFHEHKSILNNIRSIVEAKGGKLLSKTYNAVERKVTVECSLGHKWTTSDYSIRNGTWCSKCAGLAKGSIEDMKEKARNKNGQCISVEYINSNTKLEFTCEKNHHFYMEPSRINQGKWCPKCSKKQGASWKRINVDRLKTLIESKSGKLLSNAYENTLTKVQIECDKGHVWETKPANVLYSDSWCPVCKDTKLNIETFKEIAKSKHGECLSDTYINVKMKLKFKCIKGHVWETTARSIRHGSWCPQCVRKKTNK